MKKYKIMFWVATSLIFITQGIMEMVAYFNGTAETGIIPLGYPHYFVTMIVVAKVLGSLALILPQIPAKVKEWAYAGFTFDFIAALISMWVVFGFSSFLLFPVIAIVILGISYYSFHKINSTEQVIQ